MCCEAGDEMAEAGVRVRAEERQAVAEEGGDEAVILLRLRLVRPVRTVVLDEVLNVVQVVLPQLSLIPQEPGDHVSHQGSHV